MAIKISNLTPAGSDLFADTENFLTDLQDTDSTQVFGGGYKGCSGGSKGKGSKNKGSKGKGSKNKGSKGGGYGCYSGCH